MVRPVVYRNFIEGNGRENCLLYLYPIPHVCGSIFKRMATGVFIKIVPIGKLSVDDLFQCPVLLPTAETEIAPGPQALE
jgi:hypothetical protein